ncbi:MAG TPA: FhaA domain-containing protein [Pyrinomonadaceae bacterium]|nr:FhaA domain-containing protein [Pyrinomonadaceae bacterium]
MDKVRQWIDGETAELVLEQAARDAQVKPRSKAEEFIVKIAREVESVMQNEMVPLPQGTTIIPGEYIIFLSGDDDKEWQGVKRRGLEQGLYHILAERAREIAGKKKLETKSFVIELRVDATLEKGDVRVQHSWEDANNKTGVLARPKNLPEVPTTEPKPGSNALPRVSSSAPATNPNIRFPAVQRNDSMNFGQTVANSNIDRATPIPAEDGEEMTRVGTRSGIELYKLEIWRGGVRQNVVPIFQKEIVVGRGSKSKPVDIPLAGDVEVSRRHLSIFTDGSGKFWAVNEGKNPASINNYELPAGQQVQLTPGVPLNVCSYMLRIQPN